jgi:hypothetical protein
MGFEDRSGILKKIPVTVVYRNGSGARRQGTAVLEGIGYLRQRQDPEVPLQVSALAVQNLLDAGNSGGEAVVHQNCESAALAVVQGAETTEAVEPEAEQGLQRDHELTIT